MTVTLCGGHSDLCAVRQVGQGSSLFQMAVSDGSRVSVQSPAVNISFLLPHLNEECNVRIEQYCGAFA
jgi:hypothetical protein